jgi:hypothetical protein
MPHSWYLFLVLGLCASGCKSHEEAFAAVSGAVTINGQPLTAGTVTFVPDAGKGNGSWHRPIGVIDGEGRYQLSTVNRTGAPLGWYKVLVHSDENQQSGISNAPLPPKWRTHLRYTSEKNTPLSIEIRESTEPGGYDLRLTK